MSRKIQLIVTFISMITMIFNVAITQADEVLPVSGWYAVVWNRTSDTLHWINSVTEIASIQRPKLPNEAQPSTGTDVYISPDGRTMLVIAGLQSGHTGIGFYDFQSGEFIQTHEGQEGEYIVQGDDNPFSFDSQYVALGLTGGNENGWRVIAFETATGDVIRQLNQNDNLPNQLGEFVGVPRIAHYDIDEGLATWRVHIRLVKLGPAPTTPYQPTLSWYPADNSVFASNSFPSMVMDYDVMPQTDQIIYSELRDGQDPAQGNQIFNGMLSAYNNLSPVFNQNGVFIYDVEWVANGLMIAFRAQQDPYASMWYLMPFIGGEAVPFAPDYEKLYGTSDGFMIVDLQAGEINFTNTLQVEAFAPTVGITVFTTDTMQFDVIYVTPMGTIFQLPSIATPNSTPVIDMPDNVQVSPISCGTVPAPRLEVAQTARVTFTDGTPLNLRTSPQGELLTQLSEGTTANVVEGPVCANGYLWWKLQLNVQDTLTSGWAAEGDANDYYLEPFVIVEQPEIQAPQVTPTELPQIQFATPQPTQPSLNITALGDGNCSNAPAPTGITTGQVARTVNINGTLAMRTNLNDEFPTYQIPNNTSVNVLSAGVCHRGFRMWQVSLTLNGQQVTGWIADGVGQIDYLRTGPARAQ